MNNNGSLIGDKGLVKRTDRFGTVVIAISIILSLILVYLGVMAIIY